MCRISSEYLNICLSNHILLRIIACHILLSIAIDKQLFFCDFDFYRFPISIDNKRLILSIVSDPRFDTHQRIGFSLEPLPSNRDHFLRQEWDQLSSDEFAVVIWRIRIKNFPNFGITDRKNCVKIGIILYRTEILAVKFFLSTICITLYVSISWLMLLIPALLPPVLAGPLSKIWQKKWSGRDQTGYDRVLVKIIQAASNFRPIKDDHS